MKQKAQKASEHNVVKNNITEALARQRNRFGEDGKYNSSLSSYQASTSIKLDSAAKKFLAAASDKLNLSARSYFKVMKVAQTIADLDGADLVTSKHLAEALSFRRR